MDVPAYVLPPEVETKDEIDGLKVKLGVQLMLRSFPKVGYVLAVSESTMGVSKIDSFKKIITEFVKYFDEVSDELIESVGLLVTKTENQSLNSSQVGLRLENILKEMENHPEFGKIQRLLKYWSENHKRAISIHLKGKKNIDVDERD